MVTHPCASALASPFAAPNAHDTAAPGATFGFWTRRRLTSAIASVGTVNDVLRSAARVRNSFNSTTSALSATFFQRKNALTCPDFLSAIRSGQGSGSLVEALVNAGYAWFFLTASQSKELTRSLTFRICSWLFACPNGPQYMKSAYLRSFMALMNVSCPRDHESFWAE